MKTKNLKDLANLPIDVNAKKVFSCKPGIPFKHLSPSGNPFYFKLEVYTGVTKKIPSKELVKQYLTGKYDRVKRLEEIKQELKKKKTVKTPWDNEIVFNYALTGIVHNFSMKEFQR